MQLHNLVYKIRRIRKAKWLKKPNVQEISRKCKSSMLKTLLSSPKFIGDFQGVGSGLKIALWCVKIMGKGQKNDS